MTRDYEKARDIDADVDDEMALLIGFRNLVLGLADIDEDAEQTGDIGMVEATYRALDEVESLQERVAELEAENEDLRTRLDKLGDIGEEKTSKEQKIAAIVTYADNQRSNGQAAVTVLPKVIKGLVDVTRRYAYDLVDAMVEEYDWAHDPQALPTHLEQDTPQKGVVIDFEGVHGAACPVNKFTTQATGMGVAD